VTVHATTRHHGQVSDLPPDPGAYDDPRNARARAKGLEAPYIAGGEDPDPVAGLAEERRYGRLLVAMVIVIVGAGFVIGTVLALAGFGGG
jgi:hypothetical protein